ncbi:MAG: CHAT domain-containing protein [Pyrinomonadaceae bacterium]
MNNSLQNENLLREYLLGRIADDAKLTEIEALLFADDDFCTLAEITEDALINDYVFGRLDERDRSDFDITLENIRVRREKVAVAVLLKEKATEKMAIVENVSILDSIKAFFRQPAFVGGLALLLIVIAAGLYFFLIPKGTELADLKAIYTTERPTESRISDFEYAPVVTTRGAAEDREAARLRRIELKLMEKAESTPTVVSFHALGVFYLTQQKFPQAIEALGRSLKIDPKNARALNDLGSTYFERARNEPDEQRFRTLSTALENFSKAAAADPNSLAALFNKALCLQQLRIDNEARESWRQYLTLDATSGWAAEARKNLDKLEGGSGSSKTKEDAAADVIAAYKSNNEATAWRIASQTRETVTGVWLPDQLTRKFLDAKIRGDDAEAKDAIGALKFIGELERSRNADFFVSEMAEFYATTANAERLLFAKDAVSEGFGQINSRKLEEAKQSFTTGRDAFATAGDRWNSLIADLWLAHALSDLSKVAESDIILNRLTEIAERNNYKWLSLVTGDWVANNQRLRGEIGRSTSRNIRNLDFAEQIGDAAMRTKLSLALADSYETVGEVERAAGFVGRLNAIGPLYIRSGVRSWQRNFYSSKMAAKLGLLNTADHFAQESLLDVRNSPLKSSQAVDDTLRHLVALNRQRGDFAAALSYAAESQKLAGETEDLVFRAKLMRYAMSQVGDLRREMGNHDAAINAYEEATRLRADDAEVQIDAYEIEKGKLLSLFALGRNDQAATQLARTLELSESLRSKILDESSRLTFFNAEQSVFEAAISDALARNDPIGALDLTETSRARNLLDFIQGEAAITKLEDEFRTVSRPSKLSEIHGSIPQNVQVVQYLTLPDKLVVWCVARHETEMVVTEVTNADIEGLAAKFLDESVNGRKNTESEQQVSNSLYKILIEPVLPLLDSKKQLVIVPDKTLSKLPFVALRSAATGRYLIEDFTVSYSPSVNVFVRMSEIAASRRNNAETIAAVGNPGFDREKNPEIKDLPAAADEAQKIAEMYPSNDVMMNDQATKSAVLAKLNASHIFHFAGHYVTNPASLPNSRLVLADTGDESDLRLSELAKQKLRNTKFVVLSACDTNAEQIFAGEGATGIAHTFLAIGAPLVVAGNWKVDSDSTRDLMVDFHSYRQKQNLNVAEALRQAQLGMMRGADGSIRPTYFWAAFSSVGGATTY